MSGAATKVVLLTGATGGIGQATARALAASAAHLFLQGRDAGRLHSLASVLQATACPADLTESGAAERIARQIEREAGRLDVLINCAGQLEVGPAAQLGVAVAEQLLHVNFLSVVAVIDACLPLLRRGQQPVIVNVSSLAGKLAPPYMAAYAASKFALNGYSYALRQELRAEGIHVGLVLPGPVRTPMVQGKLHGPYYPLPPGVSVAAPEHVARAIARVVKHRRDEVFVPQRLGSIARLGAAFPRAVDLTYRRLVGRPRPGSRYYAPG